MLVERMTFRAKYGRGDELVALFREQAPQVKRAGGRDLRLYTDATGQMFTVQLETTFDDWASYARFTASDQTEFGTPSFQEWFRRMVEVTESGARELLNVETL